MEWIAGAALLPLLMCGVMCVGGVLLAAFGLRRNQANDRSCCNHTDSEAHDANEAQSDHRKVEV